MGDGFVCVSGAEEAQRSGIGMEFQRICALFFESFWGFWEAIVFVFLPFFFRARWSYGEPDMCVLWKMEMLERNWMGMSLRLILLHLRLDEHQLRYLMARSGI